MKTLRIGENLSLPLDTVTDTIGILAIKGAGKTHTSMVLAEELAKQGLPVVVFDVVGVCWGLRLAADGKGKGGLPFILFGGRKGDVPLEPTAGKVIADFVVAERPLVVLDLSGFETKSDQNRFIKDFCTRVYQTNRDPLHLVMDEADDYLPQKPLGDDAFTLRAVEVLVRRGRARGIGVTLITQRSAAINKGVLTQISTLIVGRTTSPQDRKAVREWVDAHGTDEEIKAFWDSLASLPDREKWVWSPTRDVFARTTIRARETFDSSSTPKVGATRPEPQQLGPVDLDALRTRIADTIERAKADDPKELRATIKALNVELTKAAKLRGEFMKNMQVGPPTVVEVPALTEEQLKTISECAHAIGLVANELRKQADQINSGLASVAIAKGERRPPLIVQVPTVISRMAKQRETEKALDDHLINGKRTHDVDRWKPGKCERALLQVLAQREGLGTNDRQLSVLAAYSITSSTFMNALGALRSRDLAVGGRDDIRITAIGLAMTPEPPPLPSGDALLAIWLSKLPKAESALLSTIYGAHPKELSKDELADRAAYTTTSSTFMNALGALRSLALVVKGSTRLGSALADAAT